MEELEDDDQQHLGGHSSPFALMAQNVKSTLSKFGASFG